jgi:REP element-mobilizing transposase RayT
MKRSKPQQEFKIQGFKKPDVCFGGKQFKTSNPKVKRPLESKLPIHIILRANQGGMRLPKTYEKVQKIVYGTAKKYGVRIYEESNVGNHIHLVVKLSHIRRWRGFIRELTGRIALLMKMLKIANGKFWKYRPFTRIVQGWNKAFRIVKEYVQLNELEARGFINRAETKTLKDLSALFAESS